MQPLTSAPSARRLTIVQGESLVSQDPALTLTTILGSCIACCLYDCTAGVGGMNHFLLGDPPPDVRAGTPDAERYGLFAMERLVNAMLSRGASRSGMRAHLYGGANLHSGMRPIGDENSRFTLRFLEHDGILLVHRDLGGTSARRVDFQPAAGRARCRRVSDVPLPVAQPVDHTGAGLVELF
jgi:chemotaxis protein CheD